jgi:hypothetical protein
VNTIEQVLARVPVTEGFLGLHLVELSSGQVLASIAPDGGGAPAAAPLAATLTDVVHLLTSTLAVTAVDEDLEDLIITLSGHHHLVRLVPAFAGTDAFLVLTLDRARGNLAMARHLLMSFEAGLVA